MIYWSFWFDTISLYKLVELYYALKILI